MTSIASKSIGFRRQKRQGELIVVRQGPRYSVRRAQSKAIDQMAHETVLRNFRRLRKLAGQSDVPAENTRVLTAGGVRCIRHMSQLSTRHSQTMRCSTYCDCATASRQTALHVSQGGTALRGLGKLRRCMMRPPGTSAVRAHHILTPRRVNAAQQPAAFPRACLEVLSSAAQASQGCCMASWAQ